jgi:cytochrome P450
MLARMAENETDWKTKNCTTKREMVQLWTRDSEGGTAQMLEDLRNLSLNVLAAAAYGKPSEFTRFGDEATKDVASFRDAMYTIQRNAIIVMMTPKWLLSGPWVPRGLARLGRAAQSLKGYMTETIAEETRKHLAGEPVSPGILSSLIRANQNQQSTAGPDDSGQAGEDEDEVAVGPQRMDRLSPDEVLGNMFVIDFAGYDTTANALSFIMMLLAAHPEVQDWVAEEISIVAQGTLAVDWNYDMFSRLKRCQALFLETLRVYPPITAIPKMTTKGAQTLQVGDISIAVPPHTEIFPLMIAIQTDPAYWDDPFEWKPSRWLSAAADSSKGGEPTGEELVAPQRGTFFPWSDGPQGCVGKKFAQVEGAAMLACLLQRHRVRVRPRPGETGAQARQRAKDCVHDVNYHLLLKMNHPDDVELECVEEE